MMLNAPLAPNPGWTVEIQEVSRILSESPVDPNCCSRRGHMTVLTSPHSVSIKSRLDDQYNLSKNLLTEGTEVNTC